MLEFVTRTVDKLGVSRLEDSADDHMASHNASSVSIIVDEHM